MASGRDTACGAWRHPAGGAARAAVPKGLQESTVGYAATASAAPTSIAVITEGVLMSMFLRKIKLVMAAAAVVVLAAGAAVLGPIGNRETEGWDWQVRAGRSSSYTYHILVPRNGEPLARWLSSRCPTTHRYASTHPARSFSFNPSATARPMAGPPRKDVPGTAEPRSRTRKQAVLRQPLPPRRTTDAMYVNVYSTDEGVNQDFLYNFATSNIRRRNQADPGHRPSQHSRQPHLPMRVWLNPDRMRHTTCPPRMS